MVRVVSWLAGWLLNLQCPFTGRAVLGTTVSEQPNINSVSVIRPKLQTFQFWSNIFLLSGSIFGKYSVLLAFGIQGQIDPNTQYRPEDKIVLSVVH